jgi:hypothetical protein
MKKAKSQKKEIANRLENLVRKEKCEVKICERFGSYRRLINVNVYMGERKNVAFLFRLDIYENGKNKQ